MIIDNTFITVTFISIQVFTYSGNFINYLNLLQVLRHKSLCLTRRASLILGNQTNQKPCSMVLQVNLSLWSLLMVLITTASNVWSQQDNVSIDIFLAIAPISQIVQLCIAPSAASLAYHAAYVAAKLAQILIVHCIIRKMQLDNKIAILSPVN